VVHVPANGTGFPFEQGDALAAGMKKNLALVLAVYGHAQHAAIEVSGALHIGNVQHDVVDPVGFNHCLALPFKKNARNPAQSPL
jgi:hypothetical protein